MKELAKQLLLDKQIHCSYSRKGFMAIAPEIKLIDEDKPEKLDIEKIEVFFCTLKGGLCDSCCIFNNKWEDE